MSCYHLTIFLIFFSKKLKQSQDKISISQSLIKRLPVLYIHICIIFCCCSICDGGLSCGSLMLPDTVPSTKTSSIQRKVPLNRSLLFFKNPLDRGFKKKNLSIPRVCSLNFFFSRSLLFMFLPYFPSFHSAGFNRWWGFPVQRARFQTPQNLCINTCPLVPIHLPQLHY